MEPAKSIISVLYCELVANRILCLFGPTVSLDAVLLVVLLSHHCILFLLLFM